MSATLDDPRIAKGMRAQMELRKRRFDEGAHQVGWKVGFGAPAAQAEAEADRAAGRLPARSRHARRRRQVSIDALAEAGRRGGDRGLYRPGPAGACASRDDVRKADRRASVRRSSSPTSTAPMDDVEAILSGDIFQRHVVLGQRDIMRQGARLAGLKGRVARSGNDVPVPADLETNIGDMLNIVRHVADVAAAIGDGCAPGSSSSAARSPPPMFLEKDESGVDFALEPIGAISVKFQA